MTSKWVVITPTEYRDLVAKGKEFHLDESGKLWHGDIEVLIQDKVSRKSILKIAEEKENLLVKENANMKKLHKMSKRKGYGARYF